MGEKENKQRKVSYRPRKQTRNRKFHRRPHKQTFIEQFGGQYRRLYVGIAKCTIPTKNSNNTATL